MVQIMDQRRHHQQVAITPVQPCGRREKPGRHHDMREMASMVISVAGPLPRREGDQPAYRPVRQAALRPAVFR